MHITYFPVTYIFNYLSYTCIAASILMKVNEYEYIVQFLGKGMLNYTFKLFTTKHFPIRSYMFEERYKTLIKLQIRDDCMSCCFDFENEIFFSVIVSVMAIHKKLYALEPQAARREQ